MGLLDIYNNGGTQLNQIYNDLSTNYPQTNTGVPTNTQNPGGPVQNFNQEYNENNTYVNNIGTGVLDNTLPITNFDVENPSVQGGPASSTTDPTSYSPYISGVPTNTQNPGGPVKKFNQTYTPNNKYITSNSPGNVNSGQLQNTLDITNFDVENPSVQGGPASSISDPTNYPQYVSGVPTNTQNPGGPVRKFQQIYEPTTTYLSANPIQGFGSGKLDDSLDITNLDVENPSVQGGPLGDNTTQYPSTVTGTPTTFANPGGPLTYFYPNWTPSFQYIYNVPNGGDGELRYTLNITNFDVENPSVQGGPASSISDPTNYSYYSTGVPTILSNYSVTQDGSGTPASKFNQLYSPLNKYIVSNPPRGINSGQLQNTLDITNFDVENPSVQGGPLNDTVTMYPLHTNHTSPIRGWFAFPSSASANFIQIFKPTKTYENFIQSYI
jgi:hypothetical protein